MSNGTQQDRRTLARERATRKRLFASALAFAGQRQLDFAKRNEIDPAHLSKVLNGKRDSLRLTAKIDAFIREQLGERAA